MPHNPLDTLKRRVKILEQTEGQPTWTGWCDTEEEYQAILAKYGSTHKVIVVGWGESPETAPG